jgi:hypothetical protein
MIVASSGPPHREDDLGVAARRGSGVHDDLPLDHLGVDVIGQHLDDVVGVPHAIKDRCGRRRYHGA